MGALGRADYREGALSIRLEVSPAGSEATFGAELCLSMVKITHRDTKWILCP